MLPSQSAWYWTGGGQGHAAVSVSQVLDTGWTGSVRVMLPSLSRTGHRVVRVMLPSLSVWYWTWSMRVMLPSLSAWY